MLGKAVSWWALPARAHGGPRAQGRGSCRPPPHGSEGSLPPSYQQAPPLNPQPEPTGGDLPTPRPACPGDQPQVSPVLAAATPPPTAGGHPLVPSGPQASFLLQPTLFPLLSCLTRTLSNKRIYTRPLEEILPGVRKPGTRGTGQGAPKLGPGGRPAWQRARPVPTELSGPITELAGLAHSSGGARTTHSRPSCENRRRDERDWPSKTPAPGARLR